MRRQVIGTALVVGLAGAGLLVWISAASTPPAAGGPPYDRPLAPEAFDLRCAVIVSFRELNGAARRQPIEREIYTAIIRTQPGREQPGLVVVESISIPIAEAASAFTAHELKELPAGLQRPALEGSYFCFPFVHDQFPPNTVLAAHSYLHPTDVAMREFWPEFRRSYGTSEWWAFSQVYFDRGERDALVFYEQRCEGACGEGAWIWLHRDDGPWRVMKRVLGWQG